MSHMIDGNFTSEQYEKIVRSLQRKVQIADNDVRAHQEVISKLESQLTRSENAVRDVKRQMDTLNREKQTYAMEIESLREAQHLLQQQLATPPDSSRNSSSSSRRSSSQSQEQVLDDDATCRCKDLQRQLAEERKLKEKAEKARRILENRMEELMTKRNKFMCF